MEIPRAWIRVSAEGELPDGRSVPVTVWGWGKDEPEARRSGDERLRRLLERLRRGEPFPDRYLYGSRPVKEEILETIEGASPDEPSAILTRNGYGAVVLNAARLLFLDIDFPRPSLGGKLRRLFGGAAVEDRTLDTLRAALRGYGKATFRIYRTAAGLRAIAVDRDFDPTGAEAQALMQATGTDRSFAHLCRVQKSFRARLTPKPWRCEIARPPRDFPRLEPEQIERFETWLADYDRLSAGYATCSFLETIGEGHPRGDARLLVELHDRLTRCQERLPLA
jgi:hypothetical protein